MTDAVKAAVQDRIRQLSMELEQLHTFLGSDSPSASVPVPDEKALTSLEKRRQTMMKLYGTTNPVLIAEKRKAMQAKVEAKKAAQAAKKAAKGVNLGQAVASAAHSAAN